MFIILGPFKYKKKKDLRQCKCLLISANAIQKATVTMMFLKQRTQEKTYTQEEFRDYYWSQCIGSQ